MNKFEVWQLIYRRSEDGSRKSEEKTTMDIQQILVLNFGLPTLELVNVLKYKKYENCDNWNRSCWQDFSLKTG